MLLFVSFFLLLLLLLFLLFYYYFYLICILFILFIILLFFFWKKKSRFLFFFFSPQFLIDVMMKKKKTSNRFIYPGVSGVCCRAGTCWREDESLSPPWPVMPPKKKAKTAGGKKNQKRALGGKRVQQKNPAEFFAENQNIAGFDNPGKALYTTIRELVENSLDAAESIQVLPSIQVEVTELSQKSFDAFRGSEKCARQDLSLYHKDYPPEGDAAPTKEGWRWDKCWRKAQA